MMKKELAYSKSVLITLVVMISGWAVFSLAKLGVEGALLKLGIVSEPLQYVIIILLGIVVLALLGFGVKKAVGKVVGKK